MAEPSVPTYDVVSPIARPAMDAAPEATRPSALAGRRIGFIWDYVFHGDEMFGAIEHEISTRFEDVTFVGYDVFGNVHGPDEDAVLAELPDIIRHAELDAVIAGVGA